MFAFNLFLGVAIYCVDEQFLSEKFA